MLIERITKKLEKKPLFKLYSILVDAWPILVTFKKSEMVGEQTKDEALGLN